MRDTPARDLAFGDRRRVELARAAVGRPGLLLLDEPAAGLNADERRRLRDDILALRRDGITVLLIEHDMSLVMEVSDRVIVLEFGKLIADGKPSAVQGDRGRHRSVSRSRRLSERLVVQNLDAGYGRLHVLRGVSLAVGAGEFVAVLGANGAGKTTLLRAISQIGNARVTGGTITFDGRSIAALAPDEIVRRGLLHVPEGRRLFTELSVDDNLRLGGYLRPRAEIEASVGEVYERFPALAARKRAVAFGLSGGEQQMLAIGRALVAKPSLLMLDEPSTGLAPRLVESIFAIIAALRAEGTSILLVEQNARLTLRYADRAHVFEHGEVALSGAAATLAADPRVQAIYLGAHVDSV